MPDNREFGKLLLASFISQTGSHFLTLALSAFVLMTTGSPVQAALVFVVSFFPSILVSSRLGHWVDSNISKWLIARNELISILATLLSGVCIRAHLPMVFLCTVLGLRSLLMFVGRSAAMKWLKLISPPALQTRGVKLFYLSFFLSTAVSGILVALVLRPASIWMTVLLDALSYVLGMAFYLTLKPAPLESFAGLARVAATPAPSLWHTLRMIFAMPAVRTSFLLVCGTQALFQGAYSAFVSYLPIRAYQLGVSGVGSYQLAASIGITGGFMINWLSANLLTEKSPVNPKRALGVSAAAILALIASVSAPTVGASLISFFGLNLAYEAVWLHHNSEFFRASPKDQAARYQFTLASCAAFLMSLTTLAYSAAVQYLGPAPGTVTVLLGGLLLWAIVGVAAAPPLPIPVLGEE